MKVGVSTPPPFLSMVPTVSTQELGTRAIRSLPMLHSANLGTLVRSLTRDSARFCRIVEIEPVDLEKSAHTTRRTTHTRPTPEWPGLAFSEMLSCGINDGRRRERIGVRRGLGLLP